MAEAPITINIMFKVFTEELERAASILNSITGILQQQMQFRVEAPRVDLQPTIANITELGETAGWSDEQILAFREGLSSLMSMSDATGRSMREFTDVIETMAEDAGVTTNTINQLLDSIAPATPRITRTMTTAQMFSQALTPLSRGLLLVTSEIYWLGIGAMFVAMSLSRLQQRSLQLERAQLSYARALADITVAQRSFIDAVVEYGPASSRAAEAYGRLIEVQEAARVQHEMLRQAIRAELYTRLQTYLGATPLVINAIRSIIYATILHSVANKMAGQSNMVKAKTDILAAQTALLHGKATGIATKVLGLFSQATLMTALAVGQLIIALGILIWTFIEMARIEAEVNVRMREIEQMSGEMASAFSGLTYNAREFDYALAGHSLLDSIVAVTGAMRELNAESQLFNRVRPAELRAELIRRVDLEPIREFRAANAAPVNITVVFNNPVVRSEADIEDIKRKVEIALLESSVAAGVRL